MPITRRHSSQITDGNFAYFSAVIRSLSSGNLRPSGLRQHRSQRSVCADAARVMPSYQMESSILHYPLGHSFACACSDRGLDSRSIAILRKLKDDIGKVQNVYGTH